MRAGVVLSQKEHLARRRSTTDGVRLLSAPYTLLSVVRRTSGNLQAEHSTCASDSHPRQPASAGGHMRVLEMDLSTSHGTHMFNYDRVFAPGRGHNLKRANDRDAPSATAKGAVTSPKLTIFFVTEEILIYVIEFFRVFFSERLTTELEICGMAIDQPFHESIGQTFRRVLRFYGYRNAIRLGLRFICARLRGDFIKALATSANVPFVSTQSVNDPKFIQRLRPKSRM